jgi:hypothetical protein
MNCVTGNISRHKTYSNQWNAYHPKTQGHFLCACFGNDTEVVVKSLRSLRSWFPLCRSTEKPCTTNVQSEVLKFSEERAIIRFGATWGGLRARSSNTCPSVVRTFQPQYNAPLIVASGNCVTKPLKDSEAAGCSSVPRCATVCGGQQPVKSADDRFRFRGRRRLDAPTMARDGGSISSLDGRR